MKTLKSLLAVSMVGLMAVAHAGHDDDDDYNSSPATVLSTSATYTDWARVTRVTPQYQRVNDPRRECRTEVISREEPVYTRPRDRSPAGLIIGGVTGGIVGNQVGKGRGRTAATAVGAVIGAIVGDRIDNGMEPVRRADYYEPREREINRCHVVDNWENRLSGYQVDYDYNGRSYTRLMNNDPGRKFKVRVSVEPE